LILRLRGGPTSAAARLATLAMPTPTSSIVAGPGTAAAAAPKEAADHQHGGFSSVDKHSSRELLSQRNAGAHHEALLAHVVIGWQERWL
jgi:hypothetical protein